MNRSTLVSPTIALAVLCVAASCTPVYHNEVRTFGDDGELVREVIDMDGQIRTELRRQFANTLLTGEGRIQNDNEGLARRAATQLAVAELAAKVETEVQANQRIYNNADIRDVVQTRVQALVTNYEIDFAGYEETWYVVKISLSGTRLVEEFERHLHLK